MLNDQRRVIFEQRKEIMSSDDVSDQIADFREEVVEMLVARHIPEKAYAEQWDAAGLQDEVQRIFGVDLPVMDWTKEEGIADEEVRERILKAVEDARRRARRRISAPKSCAMSKRRSCCRRWTTTGASTSSTWTICASMWACAAMASAIPLNEYKSEAFELFENLLAKLRTEVVRQLMHVQIQTGAAAAAGSRRPCPRCRPRHHRSADRRERDGTGRGMLTADGCRWIPTIPATWEQGPAQCALPVRLGPQVQALPRGAGLSRHLHRFARFRALCA